VDLSAIVDRELDTKSLSEVQRHLHGCRDCSVDLARLRDFDDFLVAQLSTNIPIVSDQGQGFFARLSARLPDLCSINREEFSAYLDGELTAAAKEGITSHLHKCSGCLSQFSSLNSVNQRVVRGLELPGSISLDLWSAIKEQLSENCALISTELSAFIDQEVPSLRHRHVAVHLSECSNCNSAFQSLAQTSDLIKGNYVPILSPQFDLAKAIKSKIKLAEEVEQSQAKTKAVRKFQTTALGIAAIILLFGALLFLVLVSKPKSSIVTAEDYLIETALEEPSESAEVVVYDQ
jgi:anti-sigma factor RsiW